MRKLLWLSCVLVSFDAFAVDDEAVFERMTHQGYDLADLRLHYKTGCDSGVQRYMNICAQYHFVLADMELDEAYQGLLNTLDGEYKGRLAEAQEAWSRFRTATCAFASESWRGGSGYGMIAAECSAQMARLRTKQLTEYRACETAGTPLYLCAELAVPR
jgi:uncharacterized protein YecT (DUF1311 family)